LPDKVEILNKLWEVSMSDGHLHRPESMMRARITMELQVSEADISRRRSDGRNLVTPNKVRCRAQSAICGRVPEHSIEEWRNRGATCSW
jgi:hypothetical protein